MQEHGSFFVRVNYSIQGKDKSEKCTGAHITKIKVDGENKYLIGGGYINRNGGSFLFKVKNLKEANEVAKNSAFIKDKIYSYELIILDEKIRIA
ncbi:hypothetical protein [Clostridium sp.]|uniref:hypothetical protein n=1 Tax=Clostridium sp. TaxID=1506 RepID=UPI0039F5A059